MTLLMKSIGIYIAYWDSGEKARYDNTLLSIKYVKEFVNYLSRFDIDVEFKVYDFSDEPVIVDAIWIPYTKCEFKKAEKLNIIINHCSQDIICIMDSDIIINPKDHNLLKDLMLSASSKRFYVSKVTDVNSRESLDINNLTVNFDEIKGSQRNFDPDLGGFYFMHTNILKENKFDEFFVAYGGEDNEICYRILMSGYKKNIIPIIFDHLPHYDLAPESQKTEQYKIQLNLVIEKQKELQEYKRNGK